MSAISLSDLTSQHYSACVPLRSFVHSFIHSYVCPTILSSSSSSTLVQHSSCKHDAIHIRLEVICECQYIGWMDAQCFIRYIAMFRVCVCADELSRRVARNTNKSVFVLCISRNKSTAWSARKKHAKWWLFGINIERNTTANGTQNGPEKRNKQP